MTSSQLRSTHRAYFIWLAIYAVLSLALLIVLVTSVEHVFRTAKYARTGSLRYLLIWALIVNVSSALLFLCVGRRWRARFSWLATMDLVIALGPFILIRLLRMPSATVAQYVATGYVAFLFLKCVALVVYPWFNSQTATRNSIRTWVLLASLTIYGGFAAWISQSTWPTGDGVHYLLLTHSLVADHDIDLANNYKNGDYRSFYPPNLTEHAITNDRGQALPIHDLGLSILLIPGYVLGHKTGAIIELAIPAALCALGILELSLLLGADMSSALLAWGLFAFSTPILVFASEISPEIVGAALLLGAVIAFLKFLRQGTLRSLLAGGVLVAILPWFSIRYWIFAGPLLALAAACILTQFIRGTQPRHGPIVRALTVLGLPTVVSLFVFAVYDKLHYGIFLPNAGYVLDVRALKNTQLGFTPQIGFLGLLLDRAFGLFPIAPIYILAVVGIWVLWKTNRWTAAFILVPSGCYVLFVSFSQFWFGGWSPAARFLTTVAALCAPFAALAFSSRCVPRWLGSVLAIWTLLITSIQMTLPNTRYVAVPDITRGRVGVFLRQNFGVDPLASLFPSFIRGELADYLIATAWLLVIIGGTWRLAARGARVLTDDELVFCEGKSHAST